MEKNKISMAQMALMLFLSRAFSVLTYFPGMTKPVSGTAFLYGTIIGYALSFLLFIPLFCLNKWKPEHSVVMDAKFLFPRGGTVIGGVYFLFLVLLGANTLAHFQFFMVNAVFMQASLWVILIPMMAVAVYAAYVGIEGIARSSFLIFIGFLLAFLLIFFSSFSEIELTNLKPIEGSFIEEVSRAAYGVLSRSVEILLAYLILPYLKKGKLWKGAAGFTLLSVVIFESIAFIILSALGEFSYTQTFPFFALASMSEISIFQRLDALYMAIWVFTAFIRLSLLLFLGTDVLKQILPPKGAEKNRNICLAVTSVVVFGLSVIMCYSMRFLNSMYQILYTGVPVALLALLIPLIVFIWGKLRKRKGSPNV